MRCRRQCMDPGLDRETAQLIAHELGAWPANWEADGEGGLEEAGWAKVVFVSISSVPRPSQQMRDTSDSQT